MIEDVPPGEPASKAGLKGGEQKVEIEGRRYIIGGDVIVSINGARIVDSDGLSTYLERYISPGEIIRVGILRSGRLMIVQVMLGARQPL